LTPKPKNLVSWGRNKGFKFLSFEIFNLLFEKMDWLLCHFKSACELLYFPFSNCVYWFCFTSLCRDLLYKPIVLCKAALFSRDACDYVISLINSVFFPLYLQHVAIYAVSGVSIIPWIVCASLNVQYVGINTITSQQSAKCFTFCSLRYIPFLTREGKSKRLVYHFP